MPDPITIGALVAAALSAGAIEAGKSALGAAAKDAYDKLKSVASRLLGPVAPALEAEPGSQERAAAVATRAAEQPEADRNELRDLAAALRQALDAEGRGAVFNQFSNTGSGQQFIAGGAQTFGDLTFGGGKPER